MTTAPVAGRGVSLTIGGVDIGPTCKTSNLKRAQDAQETGGYGSVGHEYANDLGLDASTFTASGWYDSTATTGTAEALVGKEGQNLAVVYGVEGSTTGKPKASFTLHIDDVTIDSPYQGLVTWAVSGKVSGGITDGTYA